MAGVTHLTHDELVDSLAGYLYAPDRLVWRDMQMGPRGSARPDVFTLFKSYVKPCPTSYEVKVTVSDFRADVTAGKWVSYLEFSSAVYFACEAGLIAVGEVPAHVGLILLRDGRWRIAKRATVQPVVLPQEVMPKLLIDGIKRAGPAPIIHSWRENDAVKKIRKKFGDEVATVLADLAAARTRAWCNKIEADEIIKSAESRAKIIREQSNCAPARAELCRVLGLDEAAQTYQIEAAVRRFREDAAQHPAARELRRIRRIIAGLGEGVSRDF